MRVLVDIAHPAHVHFYRFMLRELSERGHDWLVVARDKDVTTELLDAFSIPYVPAGKARSGMLGLTAELVERNIALLKAARRFQPDLILTRNPSGTHVGRMTRITTYFDTDNGRSAGIHYRTAAPFAHVITTPDCFEADLGPKQVRYPSYKPLAFLHPSRFRPDPTVRDRLGIRGDATYSVVRLVSMQASHDRGESGMPHGLLLAVIRLLQRRGEVFISSEHPLTDGLHEFELSTSADQFHSVLAGADLVVGDSGSVVQESAVLGVPSIFVSTFSGRTAPIVEIEQRYGLIKSYLPVQDSEVLEAVSATYDGDRADGWRRLLQEKVDLTTWYVDRILTGTPGFRSST